MTRTSSITVQTCIRTEPGQDNILEGALGLPHGTWYFGYRIDDGQIQAVFQPSMPLPQPSSPDALRVLVRVFNVNASVVSPDMQGASVRPVIEALVDLTEEPVPWESPAGMTLEKYLVFSVEGPGMAMGEGADGGLAEKLAAAKAEIERVKTKAAGEMSEVRRAAESEKTTLKSSFEEKAAAAKRKFDDEKRELEKKLGDANTELESTKKASSRFENMSKAMLDGEKGLKDEARLAREARDDLDAKYRDLENQKKAVDRALTDAQGESERQTELARGFRQENERIGGELTELRQNLEPENNRLKADNQALERDVTKLREDLEAEKTKTADMTTKITRLDTNNTRLDQENKKAKDDYRLVEKAKDELQGDFDRASFRLSSLQAEADKQEEDGRKLGRDLRAAKAGEDAVAAELKRIRELRDEELDEAERNFQDLQAKLAGYESRLETAEKDMDTLDRAKADLQRRLTDEETEREAAEKKGERLSSDLTQAQGDLDEERTRVSSLRGDLAETEERLDAFQTALTDEKAQRKKTLDDLKRERRDHAEAKGKLEVLTKTSNAKIANLESDAEAADKEIKRLKGENTKAKAEVEDKQKQIDKAKSDFDRQARVLGEEKVRVEKLNEKLKKALDRELKYDQERLYKQLDDEKAAHAKAREALVAAQEEHGRVMAKEKADNAAAQQALREEHARAVTKLNGDHAAALQKLRDDHGTQVRRLEGDITRLNGDIVSRNATITDLQNKYWAEQSTSSSLRSSLYSEQATSSSLRSNFYSEQSAHQGTRNQLAQANARVGQLQAANAHHDCVTKSSVQALVGSYKRLFDTAWDNIPDLVGITKKHYPSGYRTLGNGKLEVKFKDNEI